MAETPTNEQYAARFLRQGIESRIERLRRVIDQIEMEALSDLKRAEEGKAVYARVPAVFAHEIAWGLANLAIDPLITTASDADIAHARGE